MYLNILENHKSGKRGGQQAGSHGLVSYGFEFSVLLWMGVVCAEYICIYTRAGTLIVATIYLQLIQNGYMFRSFTVLQCSHQHCEQPVASDVEVVGYL